MGNIEGLLFPFSAAMSKQKTRVAIVGGGIGGLTCAVALRECDSVEVDIYEAAPELTQIGAGIGVWGRPWEILKELGLEHDLANFLPRPRRDAPELAFRFRKGDQREGVNFYDLMLNGGVTNFFHRADFQQALLKNISPAYRCHLSHRLISYTESSDCVVLEFQDQSTAVCDILIAADGIKSIARGILLTKLAGTSGPGAGVDPVWTGTVAYRGLIPSSVLEVQMPGHRALTTPMMYCGKDKHLVVYPISEGRLINVVAFRSQPSKEGSVFPGRWVAEVTTEELLESYSAWEDEVKVLLRCIDKPSRWAIHALNPLMTYTCGRVALIGDAAHAMTPHLGAGAGQAIEDAYILAALLSKAARNPESVPRVLQIFNTIRQPLGNGVVAASQKQGMLYEFNAPGFDDIEEGDSTVPSNRLSELIKAVLVEWEWMWSTSAETDLERALGML